MPAGENPFAEWAPSTQSVPPPREAKANTPTAGPSPANPRTAATSSSAVRYSDTGAQINEAQNVTDRQLAAAGGIDPSAPAGSIRNPYYAREGADAGFKHGDWYVDQQGQVKQWTTESGLKADAAAQAAVSSEDKAVLKPLFNGYMNEAEGALSQDRTRSLFQGYTFNTADEIAAAARAGVTGIRNLVGEGPGYSASDAFHARMEAERMRREAYGYEHPIENTAFQIVGGGLNPAAVLGGEYVAGAKGIAPIVGRGAVVGAAGGAAAGAGAGDGFRDRAIDALSGAATGAPIGAVLSGAAPIIGSGVKRIAAGVDEVGSRIRTGLGHEPGAAPGSAARARADETGLDYVRRLAERGDPKLEKLANNPVEARGKPITAAEAIGRPAEVQLKVAGRRQGQTPDALEAQLRARHSETSDRVVQDFAEVTGLKPEAIEGDFAKEGERLRALAQPLYEEAYATGPVNNEALQGLLSRPSMKEALRRAEAIAAEEGRTPADIGIVKTEQPLVVDGQTLMQNGQPIMVPGDDVQITTPTMQTWDYIKRGLDDVLEDYRDGVTGKLKLTTQSRGVAKTLEQLRGELTNSETPWGPAYRAALDAGGEPIRLEEVFGAAKRLASGTMTVGDFDKTLKGYSPAQLSAVRAGVVNQVRNAAAAGRQRLGEMATPAFKEKLTRLFGEDAAQELSQRIDDERFLQAHGQRMTPGIGSDTSETLLGGAEQQENLDAIRRVTRAAGSGDWKGALLHVVTSPVVGMMRGAQMPIAEAERDVVGALLSQKPSELYKVLQAHGATQKEASQAVDVMFRSGLFSGRAATVLADQAARFTGGDSAPRPAEGENSTPPGGAENPFAEWASASADLSATPAAYTPNSEVADYLGMALGVPVTITSGARDEPHNTEVGGAKDSAHLKGIAWDFIPQGQTMEQGAQALMHSGILFDQLEIAPDHLHVSFDPRNRRQVIDEHGRPLEMGHVDKQIASAVEIPVQTP